MQSSILRGNDLSSIIQSMYDFDLTDSAQRFIRKLNTVDKTRISKSGMVEKETYAPSKIGSYEGACSRFWYYAFNGTYGEDEPGWQGARYMEGGIDRHERFQHTLKLFDEDAVIEEEFWSEDPPMHGYIDGQVNWEGTDWIIEFKGTGSSRFKKLRSSGKPAYPYHLIQLGVYMYIKNASHGMLIYESRDEFKWFAIPVRMEGAFDKYIKYVVGWLNTLYKEINEDDLLPPRCFTKKSWQCKGCPFSQTCWDDDREVTSDITRLKEFKY